MNILLSNDDGIHAPGIRAMADALRKIANVTIVAPDSNRSAASSSLTLVKPLQPLHLESGDYCVNGTPADCVHIALNGFLSGRIDLVVSGINAGANLGDDVLYSGTVAAATEAYLLGIPAIAFSLNDKSGRYWRTAEQAVWRLLTHLFAAPKPAAPVLWNVNIPAVPENQIQGIATVRLGRRHHQQSVVAARSPRGENVYWIGAAGEVLGREEDTDFSQNEAGMITVTPLSVDLTDHAGLGSVAQFWQDTAL